MERKIIFNKYLYDGFGLKGLDSNFIRIVGSRISFDGRVKIEYIYNTTTTICIITFISDEFFETKKFRGITKLYSPDIYDKKVGEDNARAKAIIKVEKYFNVVLNGYDRLLHRFAEKNNVRKIIVNAFKRKGKKKKGK